MQRGRRIGLNQRAEERRHPGVALPRCIGAQRAVSGKVEWYNGEQQIAHPDYLLPAERAAEIPDHEAVYPATAGLAPRAM